MRFRRLETVSLLSTGILMEVSPVSSSFSTMESTSWAVASGDFKVSAKLERKDTPWATKSLGLIVAKLSSAFVFLSDLRNH